MRKAEVKEYEVFFIEDGVVKNEIWSDTCLDYVRKNQKNVTILSAELI